MSYEISGVVLCMSDLPIENATVAIDGKFSLSNEHGEFLIRNVTAGAHTLKVVHRRYYTLQQDVTVMSDLPESKIYLKRIP